MNNSDSFDEWAVVEVMGHVTYAGRVSEQSIGGGSFIRVDVPGSEGQEPYCKLLGHGSIYCITPTTEEAAREVSRRQLKTSYSTIGLPAPRQMPDEDDGVF